MSDATTAVDPLKVCSACKQPKPVTAFHFRSVILGTHHSRCAECICRLSRKSDPRPSGAPLRPVEERFWENVQIHDGQYCWLWAGPLDDDGYGRFYLKRPTGWTSTKAHRIGYILFVDSSIKGLGVFHECDNPQCVNPAHLFPGKQRLNRLDSMSKGRVPAGERHYLKLHPERHWRKQKNGSAEANT